MFYEITFPLKLLELDIPQINIINSNKWNSFISFKEAWHVTYSI